MVPAYLEELPVDPDDAQQQGRPQETAEAAGAALLGRHELRLAEDRKRARPLAALADVLRVERVSTEHHFFDDLGANSLLMARFCAVIRKNPRMSNVSMRDIYTNPTIAKLAAHLDSIDRRVRRNASANRSTFPSNLVLLHLRCAAACVLRGLYAVRPLGARHRLRMGDCAPPARSSSMLAASCLPRDRSSR